MRKSAFRHCMTVILAIAVLLITGTASAEKTILVTFTGDVTLGGLDNEQNSPESFDSYAKEKGYDYFFSNFKEMFSQDDLTVINLEGPLTDSKANKANKSHVFRGKTVLLPCDDSESSWGQAPHAPDRHTPVTPRGTHPPAGARR